jgi:hypothetical protein
MVDGLRAAWLRDPDVAARVEEGGRILRSCAGDYVLKANEDDCVQNQMILIPLMERQRTLKSLDIPDLENLKAEFKLMAVEQYCKRNQNKKSKSKTRAAKELTLETFDVAAHLDAKALKRLLGYCRARLLKRCEVRETCFKCIVLIMGRCGGRRGGAVRDFDVHVKPEMQLRMMTSRPCLARGVMRPLC